MFLWQHLPVSLNSQFLNSKNEISIVFTQFNSFTGIAALLTVIYHVDLMVGGTLFSSPSFITRVYLMVDFFFILSGFIMCHVYENWFTESVNSTSFKKFTIARFARVYPLHFVMLCYTALLFFIGSRLGVPKADVLQVQNSTYSFVTNLLLIQSMNLHTWFTWVHASWSISTEWWAYMLFPFLVKPFMRLKATGLSIILFACMIGYILITYLIVPLVTIPPEIPFVKIDPSMLTLDVAYQYGFLRCLCGFVLGMILYRGYRNEWGRKNLSNGFVMAAATILCFSCMQFSMPDFITVLFFPIIILSGAYGSSVMNKIFGSRPLQRLGDWSFSIYLVHQPLMFTIGVILSYLNPVDPSKSQGPPETPSRFISWMICIGIITLTLLFSWITYRFIEVPARKRINRKGKGVSTHL